MYIVHPKSVFVLLNTSNAALNRTVLIYKYIKDLMRSA